MFERLRDTLRAALDAATPPGDLRDLARQMREAVVVAQRFAVKHRERVGVLDKKLAALKDELTLYERELGDMQAQLGRAERDRPLTEAERSAERAWRDLQAAGGPRPGLDPADELLKAQLDRAAHEAAADRQLRELKKKMKKD